MPGPVRHLALCVLCVTVVVGAAACSGDRSGGPSGAPEAVVGNAPAHTAAARTARVVIDGPDVAATGLVDLTAGISRLDISDGSTVVLTGTAVYLRRRGDQLWRRGTVDDLPAALRPADPIAAMGLIPGLDTVRSDGGTEVRGASTISYTVHVDPSVAATDAPPDRQPAIRRIVDTGGTGKTFAIEVAVDSQGRIRRIQLPVPLRLGPPTTRVDGEFVAVTVDFVQFGVAGTVAVPTPDQVAH